MSCLVSYILARLPPILTGLYCNNSHRDLGSLSSGCVVAANEAAVLKHVAHPHFPELEGDKSNLRLKEFRNLSLTLEVSRPTKTEAPLTPFLSKHHSPSKSPLPTNRSIPEPQERVEVCRSLTSLGLFGTAVELVWRIAWFPMEEQKVTVVQLVAEALVVVHSLETGREAVIPVVGEATVTLRTLD